MDSVYLNGVIGVALGQCLSDLVAVAPADPIEWIAHWLYRYRDHEQYFHEKSVFNKDLCHELEESKKLKEDHKACMSAMKTEIDHLRKTIPIDHALLVGMRKALGVSLRREKPKRIHSQKDGSGRDSRKKKSGAAKAMEQMLGRVATLHHPAPHITHEHRSHETKRRRRRRGSDSRSSYSSSSSSDSSDDGQSEFTEGAEAGAEERKDAIFALGPRMPSIKIVTPQGRSVARGSKSHHHHRRRPDFDPSGVSVNTVQSDATDHSRGISDAALGHHRKHADESHDHHHHHDHYDHHDHHGKHEKESRKKFGMPHDDESHDAHDHHRKHDKASKKRSGHDGESHDIHDDERTHDRRSKKKTGGVQDVESHGAYDDERRHERRSKKKSGAGHDDDSSHDVYFDRRSKKKSGAGHDDDSSHDVYFDRRSKKKSGGVRDDDSRDIVYDDRKHGMRSKKSREGYIGESRDGRDSGHSKKGSSKSRKKKASSSDMELSLSDDMASDDDFPSMDSRTPSRKKQKKSLFRKGLRDPDDSSEYSGTPPLEELEVCESTWCLDCNLGLICDHPILGLLRARCPLVLPETPEWWQEQEYLAETLYDPEIYSEDFDPSIKPKSVHRSKLWKKPKHT